mmetsp:Transcript_29084/g.42711  ORF Transcript_29084/g.42711 Transcript_29084/m.42711 type:complete len:173 (-) Transcript_29084:230-748(-)|eukprot:CAMPEP_0116035214 /NCGR_PEP_ID=MMETSP0321-20121206/20183_1 /TAXON_ID=163516 /ORGANISM="Leptocylindrus danicus var. danicus, Strain B650" /LENGTH=172 /DNA_ID=CAMNT_0003511901 /DNA_START=28 /DNA_END=546 /DNA_ORIENTATION=-
MSKSAEMERSTSSGSVASKFTLRGWCFKKFVVEPCACLCASVSDLAAKLSVVASLAAAAAVGLAVAKEADIALIFAAVSSTGATIAAVLAVCGSCCTAMFDAIVGEDDSETDGDGDAAEEDAPRSQGSMRFNESKSFLNEDDEMKESEDAQEAYKQRLGASTRKVSFHDGGR